MTLSPAHLRPVADAIGDAFSAEDLKEIVLAATGNGLFEEYASESDPRRLAVRKTLQRLVEEGTERWLLIRVLVSKATDAELRRLIVTASPGALSLLLKVDDQVARTLQSLATMRAFVKKPEFIVELKQSRARISNVSDEIRRLSTYKDLHERLHALHLKLAFRSAAAADPLCVEAIENTISAARADAAALGDAAAAEHAWLAELEKTGPQLNAAVAQNDQSAANDVIRQAQRLIRLQLSRLNAFIFGAADKLSLAELIEVLPDVIKLEDSFRDLSFTIRDLKATIIARALVHKIWQDADNELSLVEDVLRAPQGSPFFASWLGLRGQVLWLASLDPDAEWAKNAKSYADKIEAELTQSEQPDDSVKPSFDTLCRVLKFRFFAIDAGLKEDWGSLAKFHEPLKQIVEEITHG